MIGQVLDEIDFVDRDHWFYNIIRTCGSGIDQQLAAIVDNPVAAWLHDYPTTPTPNDSCTYRGCLSNPPSFSRLL